MNHTTRVGESDRVGNLDQNLKILSTTLVADDR